MRSTPMAAAKTERLLNLVIALLSTRRALPKATIRERVAAYREAPTAEAFDRMFERDKDELRELGIPLITEDLDSYFDDEPAYRIDRHEYALPDLAMTPEQLSLLALAGRTWSEAALGGAAVRAIRKIEAVSTHDTSDDPDTPSDGLDRIETAVRTSDPAFESVRAAVVSCREVRFSYRGRRGDTSRRHVQPWGITAWHGHWYLTGHDVDREGPRVFRLDRIDGDVRVTGVPGAYEIPSDHDPRAVVATSLAGGRPVRARLRIRHGRGHALRRHARPVCTAGEWDVVDLDAPDVDALADEILGHGADVLVDAPAELRDTVVDRLTAVVAAHGGASA